jgi:hypothetical protein
VDEISKARHACSSQVSLLSDAGSTPAASTNENVQHRLYNQRLPWFAGRTKKEAALLAGYSSVDQMRRNIRRSES